MLFKTLGDVPVIQRGGEQGGGLTGVEKDLSTEYLMLAIVFVIVVVAVTVVLLRALGNGTDKKKKK